MTLENIKFLCESRQALIELFNDYSSIVSDAEYKKNNGKEVSRMLARVACVAKVSI